MAKTAIERISHQYGPQSLALMRPTGAGTSSADWAPLFERLAWVMGTPNLIGSVYLCNYGRDEITFPMLGTVMPEPDYDHAEAIILLESWCITPFSEVLEPVDNCSSSSTPDDLADN